MGAGDRDADDSVDRTIATTGNDESAVEASSEGLAKTRVLDDGRTEIVEAAADRPDPPRAGDATALMTGAGTVLDDLAAAETRVLDEDDKTSPPPVGPAARLEASPGAAPPRRVAPSPAARDGDRGLQPGTVLFGEYEIVNVLGVGGMGEVYRARHRRLDEHRAIKVMHAELSKRKGASEFFYREAKALLAVRHPAVVHCHDLLSDDAGRVYLIMEMIEGVPLSRKLSEGPLSVDDVAVLGARVAHGLAAAHRKGVIHRDLSPDNIVLPGGRVQDAKIIDFGIAKLLEQGEGTIVDGFKGKLSYASPEQLGFFGGKLDGRSDLYSLGLVLAAAALGRPMPMGTTVMEAVDARRSFQTLPDAIPVGLRSAIQPLLALDPKDRPQYVDRLFVVPGALDGTTDPGGLALPTGPRPGRDGGRAPAPARASRAPVLIGVAAALALSLAAALYVVPRTTESILDPKPAAADPNASAAAPAPRVSPRRTRARSPPSRPVPARRRPMRLPSSSRRDPEAGRARRRAGPGSARDRGPEARRAEPARPIGFGSAQDRRDAAEREARPRRESHDVTAR
jgi:tRNA A-37 threonylcarbamoyl transferase component Bud32